MESANGSRSSSSLTCAVGPVDATRTSEPPAPGQIFCEVCWMQTSAPVGCSGCNHRYCVVCLRMYWQSQIFSGRHNRIQCMYGICCGVMATDEDIQRVVDNRTFRKLLYFRSREEYADRGDIAWCVKEDCWEPILVSVDRLVRDPLTMSACVECRACSTKVCFDCCNPWHTEGEKCPVAYKRTPTEALKSSAWTLIHTKSCPCCRVRIQKNKGCPHMSCTRCGASFCWRCRGYLPSGWDMPSGWDSNGRACRCDAVLSGLFYAGVGALTLAGSPLIIAAAIVGGPSYCLYRGVRRQVKRHAAKRAAGDRVNEDDGSVKPRHSDSGFDRK